LTRTYILPLTFAAALLVGSGWRAGDAAAAIRIREVEIVAHDYAFVAPSELAAGQATFRFTNKGKVIHELHIQLLKAGTTPQAVVSAMNAKVPLKPLIDNTVGILIARAGHRSSAGLSTVLLAGRTYLLICRFQDSGSVSTHSQLGMLAVIHVLPAKSAALSASREDTITGADYAFKTPLRLAPGRHTLTFFNNGKARHEVNIALLRRGVTMDQAYAKLKIDGDDKRVVEEWLGVLFANPGESTTGRLHLNLLAGRDYLISCALTNDDKAPAHFTLGMFGLMRAAKR
jgi:hypothetical protein